jgi:hypothetical protein
MSKQRDTLVEKLLKDLYNQYPIAALVVAGMIFLAAAKMKEAWNVLAEPAEASTPAPSWKVERKGPYDLGAGVNQTIPLYLSDSGRLDVSVESINPDSAFRGNQPEVHVRICSSIQHGECQSRQLGSGGTLSAELPEGPASIHVFNFRENPRVNATLRLRIPQ